MKPCIIELNIFPEKHELVLMDGHRISSNPLCSFGELDEISVGNKHSPSFLKYLQLSVARSCKLPVRCHDKLIRTVLPPYLSRGVC